MPVAPAAEVQVGRWGPVGGREQAQAARTGGSQTPGTVGVELSMMAMAITQCMICVGPVVLVVMVHNNKDIASGLHDSSPNRYASKYEVLHAR